MTTEQILHILQAPEKLNQETLPLLKELTGQYPAFEAAWILYLKNLKQVNSPSFDQELVSGAIRIFDRRKLYFLLNEKARRVDRKEIRAVAEDEEFDKLFYPTEYRLETDEAPPDDLGEVARSIQKGAEKKIRLTDKFIEAQSHMPASGEAGDTTSQQEPEEPITETLANIYAQQGYYKKAIGIFEKLSLKYPEKSTYFAGRIEKIKSLMNN